MSGRKRIYVDEGEWTRLQGEARRLSELRRDVPQLIERVRQQTRADLDRTTASFEQRQRSVERDLAGLSEQAATLERETTRRLRENAQRMRRDLESSNRVLREETATMLREQRAALERSVADERAARERDTARLRQEIGDLREDHARAAELEATLLADARGLRRIVEELPHEQHAPGELAALTRRLEDAEQTRRAGVHAYGLGNAQALRHELSELRLRVEEKTREWELTRDLAKRALLVVEELIQQNEKVRLDQSLPGESPDVDYWSRGALSRLRGEVRALLDRVRDDEEPMSLDELCAIAESKQGELEERLDTIVHQAGTAIYASQLRLNFAEVVATALQSDHHYEIAETAYAGDDQRDAFYAKGKHLDGSEVVVAIEPVAEDRPDFVARILSYDKDTPSEEEREARAQSVRETLDRAGIKIADVREDGTPGSELLDFERIRRGAGTARTEAS